MRIADAHLAIDGLRIDSAAVDGVGAFAYRAYNRLRRNHSPACNVNVAPAVVKGAKTLPELEQPFEFLRDPDH